MDVDHVLSELKWQTHAGEYLVLYLVVNIPKGSPEEMTAHLIGSILMNNEVNQALQMMISNSAYSHKYPLVVQQ